MLRGTMSVTALLVLALLLTACGGSENSPTTTSAPPTATNEPTPTLEPAALSGTRWTLTSLDGETVDHEPAITLSFTAGQAGGELGCAIYGAAYTIDGNTLTTPEVIADVEGCQGLFEHTQLAEAYYSALEAVTSYQVIEERLELARADGTPALVYVRDTRGALDGTSWQVSSPFGGRPIIDDTHLTLAFSGGQVAGSGGCNTFNGSYTASDDGGFEIENLAVTEMGCISPEGIMDQEQRYLDALLAATGYRFDVINDRLELLNNSGSPAVTLWNEAEPLGSGLLGPTTWIVTDLNGQSVETGVSISIAIHSSQYEGMVGCLPYSGSIKTTPGGAIREMRTYSTWAEPCADGVPAAANAYFAALDTVTQYQLTRERLELLDASGAVVVGYRSGLLEDPGFTGTRWTLVTLHGAPVIEGTEITLDAMTGSISGNSGCNGYGGSYILIDVGIITIPSVASTAMACADPAGVMEQETAYQMELYQITGYRVTDSTLELVTSAGETTLVFERAGS